MANENMNKVLHDAMVAYKVDGIKAAAIAAEEAGMTPEEIIDALGNGMTDVGVLFERGKLFLPHVLSAAAGMKAVMDILEPKMRAAGTESTKVKASVVMGTVEGDVHDIGKSICSTMLQCAGFDVHDLGRDVPTPDFVKEVKNGCNYCGMSALMTTTMVIQKTVIDQLKAENVRDKVVIMVGGAPVTQGFADKIGADIFGETASETTRRAKERLMQGVN